MAIIANRIKDSSNISIIKTIIVTLKQFSIIFFFILSLYIFFSNPKKLSNIFLEITGEAFSVSTLIYENIFEYINFIHNKLSYLQDLEKKYVALQHEITHLKHLQNDFDALKAENIALKNLLMVVEEKEFEYVTAKLLSVSFNPFSKTALIAAGKKHGIAIDQIVTNTEGLIGKIIEVSNNYAKVMLINDINSRIPVTATSSREKAILIGDGKKSKMLYLPDNHSIQRNEKIITSGHGHIYPAGILVGYVTKTIGNEVIVNNAVDLAKTEFVQVLLSKQ